jgi:rod shape-determining protein MreD
MPSIPLIYVFLLTALCTLFNTAIFPQVHLIPFTAFLALLYLRTSLTTSLCTALLCGLLLDLINSDLRFGFYALNTCLTTLLFHQQKKHFFEEKLHSVCLLTGLISLSMTIFQWIFYCATYLEISISWKMFLIDFVLLPTCDGIAVFLWLYAPIILFIYSKKMNWKAIISRNSSYKN